MINWTKKAADVAKKRPELWTGTAGPFALRIEPTGDGRWGWRIFEGDARNPMASGVAGTLAGAKNVTEQFVNRSGRV